MISGTDLLDVLNQWGITEPTIEDIQWAATMSKPDIELNQDDIDFLNSLSPYGECLDESDFWLEEDRWYNEED